GARHQEGAMRRPTHGTMCSMIDHAVTTWQWAGGCSHSSPRAVPTAAQPATPTTITPMSECRPAGWLFDSPKLGCLEPCVSHPVFRTMMAETPVPACLENSLTRNPPTHMKDTR